MLENLMILKLSEHSFPAERAISERKWRKTLQDLNGSFICLLFLVLGLLIAEEELIMNMLCICKFEMIVARFLLTFHEYLK